LSSGDFVPPRLTVIGKHSELTAGDVRRLVHLVVGDQPRDDSRSSASVDVRVLQGGYSGLLVALVYAPRRGLFILKGGPTDEIRLEHENRAAFLGSADEWLVNNELDGIYGPVDVEIRDQSESWSAMAYRYIGSRTYRELADYSEFGAFLQSFVRPPSAEGSPPERTVRACLYKVASLLAHNTDLQNEEEGRALVDYLPDVDWERDINASLTTAAALWSDIEDLRDFRAWYTEAAAAVRVAPVADRRLIHGDAHLANILVNSVRAEVDLIDFGKGRQAHVFEDLARFEVDLILHTTPRHSHSGALVQDELLETVNLVGDDDFALRDSPEEERHRRCLRMWRQELCAVLRGTSLPGAAMMYRWFLLSECLKRIRWVTNNGPVAAGVDMLSLLRMITALRRMLDGHRYAPEAVISTTAEALTLLRCTAAYVPMHGHELLTNEKRNRAKEAALHASAARGASVRIIAETGYSYLATRGVFNPRIKRLLAAGASLQMVICNPYFLEAYGISASYDPDGRRLGAVVPDRLDLHADLARKFEASLRGYEILREEYKSLVEVRFARFGIGATVLLSEQAYFFEPYFHASRSRRERVLFDTFELQFEPGGLHMKRLLDETFSFHWNNADAITDVSQLEERCRRARTTVFDAWQGTGSG
jgi:Phosphotransferase enzyme family